MTPHDLHVLGGTRAMDDTLAAEPVPAPKWGWPQICVVGAVAFVLGIVVWNASGGVA